MKISVIFVLAVFGVACKAATIPQEPAPASAPSDLYEIDVDATPEDGTIRGLRIRRSGAVADQTGIPEIDIVKEDDGSFSVNGIRVKRSDLSDVDLDEEATEEESAVDRTRRSGDLLGIIGSKLQQKLSLIASSSSGHHAESDGHYEAPASYDSKSFDLWSFKKAILSTLLQAAKAIKGGVIALGGQIIKAKGHLISAKGKVIATKGDAITEYGKSVAAKAILHQTSSDHGSSGHGVSYSSAEHDVHSGGYSTGGGYGVPTAGYSAAPSFSGHGYTKRGAFAVPQEVPKDVHAGLLVLKPINVPDEAPKAGYGKRKAAPFAQSRDSSTSQSEPQPVVRPAEDRSFYVY